MLTTIIILLITTSCSYADFKLESGWDHSQHGLDWGGSCSKGKYQSPINLLTKWDALPEKHPLKLRNYCNLASNKAVLYNTGHTVTVDMAASGNGSYPRMSGALLNRTFNATELHFHWGSKNVKGSEHTIDGKRFDLELHIVHRALAVDDIAVMSVLFNIRQNATTKPVLKPIFDALTKVIEYHEKAEVNETFGLCKLFKVLDKTDYFTYEGSLTTPNCRQGVSWIVFRNLIDVALEDASKLRDLQDSNGEPIASNFRMIMPLNSRPVYHFKRGVALKRVEKENEESLK
ncbi:carbonic anhydrase 1 [Drosophila mojavensis]|uniref:Carbonic anhydrase n=1 Tax=Drosophila mojavensis TaxID=7230 RepID=A0A0Q9XBG0_DROMO|nr:carbonic anhydrase 1 [Drosophila mojavensis]KRG01687.1 uncharacterized protein Dmoj_GI26372 [Drosophila mojavensis]